MAPLFVRQWNRLSEDELWTLATDRRLTAEIREEAMWRWLFPEEYGYRWANLRVQHLRTHYLGTERETGMTPFVTVPTIG
jgi:hypothetical protein